MGGESPVVELYDSNGNPLSVQSGVATPANTPALMVAGSDGTNSRYITVDSSGRQIIVGAGTAGTPTGGVLSIQGVSGGQAVPVSGSINIAQVPNIDSGNSSTATLAGNATFTGTGIDVSAYSVITTFVFTDQAGTLKIQFSTDNTNWDYSVSYAIPASTAEEVQIGPQARYFRVVYTNGAVAQSVFRLQTIERTTNSFWPVIPISSLVDPNGDALLTKSVITGKNTGVGNAYVDVKVNPSGTLTVDASNSTNVGVTGTVTANQGTANTLANGWPVKITDGTNTAGVDANNHVFVSGKSATGVAPTGNPVSISGVDGGGLKRIPLTDTGGRLFSLLTDGANGTVAVKPSSVAPLATDIALNVALSPNTNLFSFGGDQRLRVGQEILLFFDNVDGTTVDVNKWVQSQSGMTQSQTGGNLTLNSGSSTGSGNYSILSSTKQMLILDEFPLYVQFRARMVQQTNAVLELGFGNATTTATPTDGVFFRIDATGNLKGVLNFNGTETTTATLTTLTASTFYNFEVTIYEDHASFEVQSSDGVTNIDVDLAIPLSNGSPISVGHLPVYARVYNSSATSAAAQIVIASVNVQQMDLNMNKPWAEQVAGAGRASSVDPSTLAQSANYTNNTAPVSATLSNTAAGYTTLGGLFQFAAVAGAETDYALFAYQVPTGFQLYVWTITITAFITGAQSSTSPTLLQWAVAANSSAVSLATGAPNPPIRTPVGMQQANKTANIGDPFNPGTITYAPKTPIVVNSGKYLHIILRIPISNATANQIIRGSCTVEGYFE